MSGRVAPPDVIAAGFLRRCPRGATAPAEERCERCGLSDDEPTVLSYFEVYRCEPEATYTVAALADGDPPLQIRIAAVGGATVGATYADNDWIYEVHLAGTLVCSGADLHSGGIARTHLEMAVVLAECLSDSGAPAPLLAHGDRLGLWAYDGGQPEGDGDRDV